MLLLHGYGVAPEREFTIVCVLAVALGLGLALLLYDGRRSDGGIPST
jgi:hypothetical protein